MVGDPHVPNLFTSLFSDDSIIVESEVRLLDEYLHPEELACVCHAVDRRRAQFGTGRVCARRALVLLGVPDVPITVGAGGAPRWPRGVVGSITHTSQYCAVVVKRSPPWRAVGLDAETLGTLDAGTKALIVTEAESRWLSRFPPQEHDAYALLLFSAKEAYYKFQYPLTKRFLDFSDVEIEVDVQVGTFRVSERDHRLGELGPVFGRFTFTSGMVLCGIELR